ncbi:hypothetical protein [Agaribacter flavus]|uniref:hypothetical protein n=1 Tax=Agaribacter flavus TaxID=1902781 RepID=UPI00366C4CE1
MFEVDIQAIDVGSIDIQMKNDLGNTMITRASVFDAAGRWLPDFVVESGSGFDYANISGLTSTPRPRQVSQPNILALLCCSIVGLMIYRGSPVSGELAP